MNGWRETCVAVLGLLALAGTVHADLIPIVDQVAGGGPSPVVAMVDLRAGADLTRAAAADAFADLAPPSFPSLPVSGQETVLPQVRPSVHVLRDGQNGFYLGLYTLFGLGLCRTAPWLKKLNPGAIPAWYHDGGPFQVGHSHAISPDCLCPAPVICFIQPEGLADDHPPQNGGGAIAPLVRESLFTPTALSSRAPPA
jgi:hypothetical protein